MTSSKQLGSHLPHQGLRLAFMALAASLLLSACGDKGDQATQTAAKVNKEEITVHQINYLLQRQPANQQQGEAAQRQALERLIDQELSVQKAQELKLDRDPRVVQSIEAAKRDIIARAFVDHVGESIAKPTPEEISKFYVDRPELFKERRIFSLQELSIEAKPEQFETLREHLQSSKNIGEFVDYLRSAEFHFSSNQAVRAAEQLPLDSVGTIAHMKDGDSAVQATANGLQLLYLAGSRSEPVDEVKARPAIEAFLLNQRKGQAVQKELKALRDAAKVEYLGRFAQAAASAPALPSLPSAASAPASNASASLDSNAVSKGLGLK